MRKIFLSLLVFLTTFTSLQAQTRSVWQTFSDDLSFAWHDGVSYFNFPSRYEHDDYRNALSVILITPALSSLDQPARDASQTLAAKKNLDNVMSFARGYGDPLYSSPVILAGYAGGLLFDSPWLRVTSRELLQSLVYSGITTTAIKYILGRSRPFNGKGAYSFNPFKVDDGQLSMPSGHTTVAFAISSVLAARINNVYASIGLYGLASLTGFSRMYHDKHWLSDVFLGAAIGTATGLYVVHAEERRDSVKSQSGLFIAPSGAGISLTYKF